MSLEQVNAGRQKPRICGSGLTAHAQAY